MKMFAFILFGVLVWVPFAQGQQRSNAEKIATLSDDQELSVFNTTLDQLVRELLTRPNTSGAFIALTGKDYATLIARYKAVRNLLRQRPELKGRTEYSQPGTKYDKGLKETEFWIVSDLNHPPYRRLTADCSCTSLRSKVRLLLVNLRKL